MESGTALAHGSFITSARDYAFQTGKHLKPSFNGSSSVELLRILQEASPEQILEASNKVRNAHIS